MVNGVMAPFDFESKPLHFRTSIIHKDTNYVRLKIRFVDKDNYGAGIIIMIENGETNCGIGHCGPSGKSHLKLNIPEYIQEQSEQYWTFQKKDNLVIIRCNQVDVIRLNYSKSNSSGCKTHWEKEKQFIKFSIVTGTWTYFQPGEI